MSLKSLDFLTTLWERYRPPAFIWWTWAHRGSWSQLSLIPPSQGSWAGTLCSRTCPIISWSIQVFIKKGVRQGCILSPCLFNFYAEYIMRNTGLEETQAGIKFAGRNINNLRYADDTTLMAESEEELKSLLMKVKVESEKVGLKLTFRKRRSWHPVPSLHGK